MNYEKIHCTSSFNTSAAQRMGKAQAFANEGAKVIAVDLKNEAGTNEAVSGDEK
ncbi:hypothetical protein [Peribacillus sp. FSL E2-0159]|uniref:hypothetical protein n=1 Tax=Peribacillus sp. FSL E2-0159 TaxID=2975289 RepID=UPI003159EB98